MPLGIPLRPLGRGRHRAPRLFAASSIGALLMEQRRSQYLRLPVEGVLGPPRHFGSGWIGCQQDSAAFALPSETAQWRCSLPGCLHPDSTLTVLHVPRWPTGASPPGGRVSRHQRVTPRGPVPSCSEGLPMPLAPSCRAIPSLTPLEPAHASQGLPPRLGGVPVVS